MAFVIEQRGLHSVRVGGLGCHGSEPDRSRRLDRTVGFTTGLGASVPFGRRRRTVNVVAGAGGVVPDPASDELFTLHGGAVALELILVDVARGDELVSGPESGVGSFGGGLEQHH